MDAALLPRRDRERLARRGEMLDAALAVFAEKGYDGATLDEVAERAEYGKGTLYNYFPGGKEALFLALFERIFEGLHAAVEGAGGRAEGLTDVASVRALFYDLLRALLAHFAAHRHALALFLKEGHRLALDAEHAAFFHRHYGELIDAVERPLRVAAERGLVRPLPVRAVAHLVMGNVRGLLLADLGATCRPDGGPGAEPLPFATTDEAADFVTTILFDGLLAERP